MRQPAQGITLNYAVRPTVTARLWRIAKWVIVGGVLAVFCISLGIPLFFRAQSSYYQTKCMNYALPPNAIVLEEDPTRAQRLAAGKTYGFGWSTGWANGTVQSYYAVNPYWDKWMSPTSWSNILPLRPLLFLHRMRENGGPDRLVCISLDTLMQIRTLEPSDLAVGPAIDWIVLQPSVPLGSPKILNQSTWHDQLLSAKSPWPLRVFAGHADATDSSHFSLQFRDPDGWCTLDGWLQPDDTLKFSSRRDTTQPAASIPN